MPQNHQITNDEYQRFKRFLDETCGIILGEGKQYLVVSRLTKLLRNENIASLSALLDMVERGYPRHIPIMVIDAMTTNETSWFRDRSPFEALRYEVFPEMEQLTMSPCRIWSAACSSGQEPYTISIALSEYIKAKPTTSLQSCQVIATDISQSMLDEAKTGIYDESILVRGLSPERRQHYFEQRETDWAVKSVVKNRVSFREQNLLKSYASLGKFDIIFCRNVLIYFSAERKADILERLAMALKPRGYLFLGASETVMNYNNDFETIRSPHGVFFRLKP